MKDLSNADLLAVLVGSASAKALAAKPLAELFGFSKPRQMQLCEEPATYTVHPALAAAKELFVRCIQERMQEEDLCFSSPETTKTFLCSKIGHLEHESFWCLWLDAQNRLIDAGELFRGTRTGQKPGRQSFMQCMGFATAVSGSLAGSLVFRLS